MSNIGPRLEVIERTKRVLSSGVFLRESEAEEEGTTEDEET